MPDGSGTELTLIEQRILNNTKLSATSVLVGAAADSLRTREALLWENALLRQQLIVLRRSVKRVQPTNSDRRLLVWLASRLQSWREALLIVKPETILMWHRCAGPIGHLLENIAAG